MQYDYILIIFMLFSIGIFSFSIGMIAACMLITKRYKETYKFWKYKGLSSIVSKKT